MPNLSGGLGGGESYLGAEGFRGGQREPWAEGRWTAIRGEAKRDAGTIFAPMEDLGEGRRHQWPAAGRGAWHTSQQSCSLKLGEKSHCP